MKEPPIFRELESLKDLARLSCAFERIPRPLFAMPLADGRFALAVHAEQLGEAPIFFYAIVGSFKPYVRYRLDGDLEEASFSDDATLTQYLHSPVLTLKETPAAFSDAIEADGQVDSDVERVELGDVNSLLKLSAYRYIMDESYAPLYLSRSGGELHLGTFVHMGDFEGSDFYFYMKLDKEPAHPFVRFDPSKATDWSFTSKTAEHGFYYAKIIHLTSDSL
ncbi:MAG TPA: hypothetical protein VMS77_04460 [Conexivisphaerales archaeon]|nr:hypothetical protein [Conexivisphaerales archaeon]